MQSTAVDAGPLIALFNNTDALHGPALEFARRARGRLVTNMVVIGEVVFMLAYSTDAQTDFLGWVEQRLDIDRETDDDFGRIAEIMQRYRDLPAGFAEAALLAMCERRGIELVATIEADFAVYRTRDGKALKNVFFEA